MIFQKTAELTTRLNVDVQEFKSCFKLTVAQGLRTITQVGGCVISLFRISPQMTLYTVAALPIVIAIGTLFGALLRSLSRRFVSSISCNGTFCPSVFWCNGLLI
ncbi:hypothetical protein OESDEN_00817 [Oesophagostomum dentatum]|uniref:ABC transmembrane type-1 domain-containing protein n=1 Tax=Oesophagostomum dentatum TaxID=61180 RepID=A0A0B1TPM8_OESDE|nr:hypothetical protein OESDEN_00817 [Oesophagostomum dentatum]